MEEIGHKWLDTEVIWDTMQLTCHSNKCLADYNISKQRTQFCGSRALFDVPQLFSQGSSILIHPD